MTRIHMERAAEIVRDILRDQQDQPRATAVADAFAVLFTAFNDRFDQTRFLQACGLIEAPAKRKQSA